MTIWIDHDRIPKDAREIVRRAGERPGISGRSFGRLLGMTLAAVAAAGCAGPSPSDSTAIGTPPARAHHRLVAIPPGDVLLVGGSTRTDSGYVWFGDIWSWRAASESWVALPPLPFTRSSHALAYDRACYDIVRERVVMFGGWDRDNEFRGDTWEWDGHSLVRAARAGPAPRAGHDMAFDPVLSRCILFGGRGDDGFFTDTWAWNGAAWEMVATGTDSPPPRWFFGMATDHRRERVVVFGGATAEGALDDTWEWDGATWSRLDVSGPPARGMSRLAFDGEQIVLFGGRQTRPGSPPFADLADTWRYDGERWSQVMTTESAD